MARSKEITKNGEFLKYSAKKKHVVIPSGIKTIGRSAFSGELITSVTFPGTVKKIDRGAFFRCRNLKSVEIPDSVTKIGECAFANCYNLESVILPAGIREISERLFEKCRSLKAVTLPEGLKEIGNGAFAGCVNLESINIPDSLVKIGNSAFKDCKRLKLVNEPECVPEIGENAFSGAGQDISEAFFAAQKRKIAIYSGCIVTVTNLRRHENDDRLRCTKILGHNVVVDNTCAVGSRLVYFPPGGQLSEEFADENHLLRYDLFGNPAGYCLHPKKRLVTTMRIRGEVSEGLALPIEVLEKYTDIQALKDGDRIFTLNGCQLCCIYIPKEMHIDIRRKTLVRYCGRKDSPRKVEIPWGIKTIGDNAFIHSRHITEVVIPETVTKIGRRAFYECQKLKKVVIPDSVVRIGCEAFANCPAYAEITLPERLKYLENSIFTANDFIITDGKLIDYQGDLRNVVIPKGVTEIGDAVFYGNSVMESVVIPTGVTRIGGSAFKNCRRLQKVSIPDTVTYIGDQAFFQCRSLHKVTLPLSAAHIGRHAFGEYYFFRYVEGLKFPIDEYRKYKRFHFLFKTQ